MDKRWIGTADRVGLCQMPKDLERVSIGIEVAAIKHAGAVSNERRAQYEQHALNLARRIPELGHVGCRADGDRDDLAPQSLLCHRSSPSVLKTGTGASLDAALSRRRCSMSGTGGSG